MKNLLVILFLATPVLAQDVEWTKLPPFRTTYKGNSLYADVLNHTPTPKGWDTRSTTAHENGHGIHAYLRNKYITPQNSYCGLYVGEDKAVLIKNPKKLRLSQVRNYLPKNLRGEYYELYLVTQANSWDDTPLYLLDEWVCYVNDNIVLLQEVAAGEKKTNNLEMNSSVEFVAYAVALGMASKEVEPGYWKENAQFRAFLKWHIQRSLDTHRKAYLHPKAFTVNKNYYNNLKKNTSITNFIKKDLEMDLNVVFPVE